MSSDNMGHESKGTCHGHQTDIYIEYTKRPLNAFAIMKIARLRQGWAGIPVTRDSRECKLQISLPIGILNFPSRSRERDVLAGNIIICSFEHFLMCSLYVNINLYTAQCVLCSVYFSAQPNKLRPILKFKKYYPVEHIFVPACSSARKIHFFKF